MRNTIRHGAEGFSFTVVVGIDDPDGEFDPHVNDKFANLKGLLRSEGQLVMNLWSDGTVSVIPGVVNAAIDQLAQPFLGEKVVDVRLAKACRDSGEKLVVEAVVESAEGAVKDIFSAASLIGDHLGAFD